MNLFNKEIYKNHLEHTAEGTKWGKHKYLYITETGRYVYPEDIQNGKSAQQFRSRQINDQIKSAHSNATSSSMRLTPGSELSMRQHMRDLNRGPEGRRSMRTTGSAKDIENAYRRDQYIRERTFGKAPGTDELERQIQKTAERKKQNEAAKVSGTAAGSKSVATNTANRNTVNIKKSSTEETKSEETKTDTGKYKNMSEETKQWLAKEAAKGEKKEGETKKGGSGKKKSSGSSNKASTKTKEAEKMGLSDDDLKNMEVNTEATNRDEVLKNIALRVIRGDYGNGADRKAKLGSYYDEVQKRVNEIMREGSITREGQTRQQTKSNSTSTSETKTETETEPKKTEFQKRNAEEISTAKELSDISGMKNSACLNLVRLYKKGINDKEFQKELDGLAEGDEKQRKRMLQILGSMKHYDLEEGLFLKHWGVKRRSGRFRYGSGDRPYQHDSGRRARNHSWKERRTMSEEDLDRAISRARKEFELYRNERDNRSVGQKFAEDVITSIGKDVLRTAGKGALLWAGKNFATKILENEELGDFIARGGPKKEKK